MKQIVSILFTVLIFSQLHSGNINWSTTPVTLSGPGVNASDPSVAVDSTGDAVAVWIENSVVKASSKPVSGNWSGASTLSTTGASNPRLVMDGNGNATAVWVAGGAIKAASKPFYGNWGSVTSLSNNGASSPTLTVDAAGNLIAAWVRNGNIETSTKLFGANWQAKSTIPSSSSAAPSIAIGGTGSNTRAFLLWQGVSNGINVIFASTKSLSGGWSPGQVISDVVHYAAQPFIAVDNNTNASAIWYSYDIVGNSYSNVVVTSAAWSNLTDSWSAVSALSKPGIRNPSTLSARVAFDCFGNAIAFWNISFDDMTFNIESSVKPVNGSWSDPVELVTSNLYAYTAELSRTVCGDTVGIYSSFNGNSLMIQTMESNINGYSNNMWSVPITISQGVDNAYPKIAATLYGNVINAAAVWMYNNGVNNTIVASTGAKTLVLPPQNLHVTQGIRNFGVFYEYYNTLSWDASYDPNVVGYAIFRNGEFLAQVGAGDLHFIDENRTFNGAVSYSVSAIDSQQTQSVNACINFP